MIAVRFDMLGAHKVTQTLLCRVVPRVGEFVHMRDFEPEHPAGSLHRVVSVAHWPGSDSPPMVTLSRRLKDG